jgi:phosphoglycerol transferase MdoB-like AlkP superfamily enzyme
LKNKLIFFLKYFLTFLLYLIFFKIVFILYHLKKFGPIPFLDYLRIISNGFKLDLSMASYIVAIPALCLFLFAWIRYPLCYRIIRGYTIILIPILTFLYALDLELYNYWHYRLDLSVFDFIDTPVEMIASLRWYHYPVVILVLLASYFLIYRLVFKKLFPDPLPTDKKHDFGTSLVFLLIIPALIIPVRGGLSTAPLNVGEVYFHKDIIVNHAAVNPIWNLIYSITEQEELSEEVNFFDIEKEESLLEPFQKISAGHIQVLKNGQPNIIIIILESFSSGLLEKDGAMSGAAPNLNRLVGEGIFFKNFYASGTLSNKGIGAIIAGYPALPTTCILKYSKKAETLAGLGKDLDRLGYNCSFYYGGDIDFGHMSGFLVSSGFKRIISYTDFPASEYFSKWGVPDHIVFRRLLKETNQAEKPFFHVFFTLSSHEPYEVPMEPSIRGNTLKDLYCNSVSYTDKYLGEFIDSARASSWWDNTLIILVPDHGARIDAMPVYDRKRFHIPMLWLGGAISQKDTVISKYGSQTDLAATLLRQLNVNTDSYRFSRDLLGDDTTSYAWYTFNKGIGYVDENSYVVYDMAGSKFMVQEGIINDTVNDRVKALLQNLNNDFSGR